jgi:catechol 2,3-dioxygenase-like lactoylglutathione lyase family enzyme
MLTCTGAFSGFSATDVEAERAFYADRLGLTAAIDNGILNLELPGGQRVIVYRKDEHQPATFTVLNLEVADIDAAVDELTAAGVIFERYDGVAQDARGIQREYGPPIAWFKDPAGNILSVLEED